MSTLEKGLKGFDNLSVSDFKRLRRPPPPTASGDRRRAVLLVSYNYIIYCLCTDFGILERKIQSVVRACDFMKMRSSNDIYIYITPAKNKLTASLGHLCFLRRATAVRHRCYWYMLSGIPMWVILMIPLRSISDVIYRHADIDTDETPEPMRYIPMGYR